VLTLDAVKPVSAAPAATAKAGAIRAGSAPAQPTTTVSHLRPAKPSDLPSGDVSPPRLDRVLAVLIPAVLILGMAIAAFILGRRGAFDRQADAGSDRVDPVTASMPAGPAHSVVSDSAALAEPKPDSIADSQPFEPPIPEPVVEPDPIPEPGPARFCLAVGTYLFEERAREKARTLSGRTGQKAWVEPTRTGGGRSYRILFGAYSSEGAAERDADRLLSRGFVTEAMVENLPAKRRGR
jgi:cell division septation protein DedD